MVLRMKNLNIWGFTEKCDFKGGGQFTKNQCRGEDCLKSRRAWAVCRFMGVLARGGDGFQGGGMILQCALWMVPENQRVYN